MTPMGTKNMMFLENAGFNQSLNKRGGPPSGGVPGPPERGVPPPKSGPDPEIGVPARNCGFFEKPRFFEKNRDFRKKRVPGRFFDFFRKNDPEHFFRRIPNFFQKFGEEQEFLSKKISRELFNFFATVTRQKCENLVRAKKSKRVPSKSFLTEILLLK
jgi:hypothetical protein